MSACLYETIPASCCEEPKHFEFQQSMNDAPLTHHPETGKRIILRIYGFMRFGGGSCCGPSACR